MRWLFLLFLILPALEIGVFIWIGGYIGPWWVVLLIFMTGLVGVAVAKQQGTEVWYRARQSINAGYTPTGYIVDGICIFVGGVFLFTPGFITDIVGFGLVLPTTRVWFKQLIMRFIKHMIEKNWVTFRRW